MTEHPSKGAASPRAATAGQGQATNPVPRQADDGGHTGLRPDPDPSQPQADELARRQADLVAALTGAAPTPPGFDVERVRVAARALMRKRAAGVAAVWPALASAADWPAAFAEWAAGRPPQGALRDGWDFARWLRFRGELPRAAGAELACREASRAYDGCSPPRRRRLPAVRRANGAVAASIWGRIILLRSPG